MGADDKCSTPSKLTLAMPKPFGFSWFAVNKLEMDKGGKFKLEATKNLAAQGVKVEVKSDLADINKVIVSKTYTGIKDLQLKHECKLTNPKDFTSEATYARGNATCGIKFNNSVLKGGLPDFGARFLCGPYFCSLLATKGISTFDFAASYKATPDVTVAVSGQAGAKGIGNASVGAVYKGMYKAKASLDGSACVSAKHKV